MIPLSFTNVGPHKIVWIFFGNVFNFNVRKLYQYYDLIFSYVSDYAICELLIGSFKQLSM